MVDQVVPLVAAGRRGEAVELLTGVRPSKTTSLATILEDLIAVLSDDGAETLALETKPACSACRCVVQCRDGSRCTRAPGPR